MRYLALTFTLLAASVQAADTQQPAANFNAVEVCDIAFDLPSQYRVTSPKRSMTDEGVKQCTFRIVEAQPTVAADECKDEEDGGSAPYDVCDWYIPDASITGFEVLVAETDIAQHHEFMGDFYFENGAWRLPNAQADAEPAQAIDFYGKPGWTGASIIRNYWARRTVTDYTGIYAGSYDQRQTLIQLSPQRAVVLDIQPGDAPGNTDCTVFCSSLRDATVVHSNKE